ncbi:AAA family ATPase [Jannaschia sp. R86511]|uniref:ParA family protein n=1 Tax=Jannaschia sp. R86511 TaxID=3093853 RepID=UPI0036D3F57B
MHEADREDVSSEAAARLRMEVGVSEARDAARTAVAEQLESGAHPEVGDQPPVSRETAAAGDGDRVPTASAQHGTAGPEPASPDAVTVAQSSEAVDHVRPAATTSAERNGSETDAPAPQRVSRETEDAVAVGGVTDAVSAAIDDADSDGQGAAGAVDVSRGTDAAATPGPDDWRDEVAAALPSTDDETPLAQELASDARRRLRLHGRTFPTPSHTRIMTVANQKGGVGKTTTAVNVAAALAQGGLRVLVVDADPQGNASTALGVEHHGDVAGIYDVLMGEMDLAEVVQPSPALSGVTCAPATLDLSGAEIELVPVVAREYRLRRAIDRYVKEADEPPHYVIIDSPPSLGLLTLNTLVAAREVFIPIQCEYYALEGVTQLMRTIELVRQNLNPELEVTTVLLTMFDGRTRLAADVAAQVREYFTDRVLRTSIPRSVRVSEAPSHLQTVMTYDPTSTGALSYLEAAQEISNRGAHHE